MLKPPDEPQDELKPFFKEIQAHYDLSNDFYALFLDPSMTYSCAYFEPPGLSLQEAQAAKIDLSLGKIVLEPGMRLLDVGCGWGATLERALELHGVRAVGLTLSKAQAEYCQKRLARFGDRVEVRLQGWEQFDEPVDRIVSIGAFEHFREERYGAYFDKCRSILPAGAPMLLHSIVLLETADYLARGHQLTHESVLFQKFMLKKIFPGGQLRQPSVIRRYAEAAGFTITRQQSLMPHYAITLDRWAAALEARRDEAIAITSVDTYDTYMKYLTGCAALFHDGRVDVVQLSMQSTA